MKNIRKTVVVFIILFLMCIFLSLVLLLHSLLSFSRDLRLAVLILVWTALITPIIGSFFINNILVVVILTLTQCLWPIFGFSMKLFFHTTLFLGPGMALAVNIFRIVGSLLCLVGLYLKEKLMIIKVFLLPVMSAMEEIGLSRRSFNSLLETLRNETETTFRLLASQVQSDDIAFDWVQVNSDEIGRAFSNKLKVSCMRMAREYLDQCPSKMMPACRTVFPPPILDKISCPPLISAACNSHIGNISIYCRFPDVDFEKLGNYVENMKSALAALNVSVSFEMPFTSFGRFNNGSTEINLLPLDTLNEITAYFWTSVGICWIYFILNRIRLSLKICRQYNEDITYENKHLDLDWVKLHRAELLPLRKREELHHSESFLRFLISTLESVLFNPKKLAKNCSLILIVLTVSVADSTLAVICNFVSRFSFKVPIHGESGFIFNVQGTSTVAQLLRAVLGGFNLISEDCEYADSSQCVTQHKPIDQGAMVLLWSLALFYCLHHGITIHTEYVLCRLCDFLCPIQAARRAEYLADDVQRRRLFLTKTMKDIFADFNCLDPDFKKRISSHKTPREQRLLVAKFYSKWRPFVNWMPPILTNLIADTCCGLRNLNCQICWMNRIEVYCDCALLCHDCSTYVYDTNFEFCRVCNRSVISV